MSIFEYLVNNNALIPENPEGNIEYKLRLDLKQEQNIKKTASQMKWRLSEGYHQNYPLEFDFMNTTNKNINEAHYVIGVYDNGKLGNLNKDIIDKSVDIFKTILESINAEIYIQEYHIIDNSNIYYAVIRTKSVDISIHEYNILFCGEENTGKTTMIGNLCYGVNDNGAGLSRNFVFKHPHEKLSGTTTSVTKEIIGINSNCFVNYSEYHNWDDIVKNSDKILNIFDIPGSIQYIKTLLYSLRTFNPDMIIICYRDKTDYTQFLENYCKLFDIKYIYVNYFNKIEDNLKYIRFELLNITIKKIATYKINNLFRITDIYNVPDRDKIVGGIQVTGKLNKYDTVKLIANNKKIVIKINTIFKKNINSTQIQHNETGSISFKITDNIKLTKYMFIVPQNIVLEYKTKIEALPMNKYINYQDGQYSLFNGNYQTSVYVKIVDNKFNIISDNNICLQDDILILLKNDYNNYNVFDKIIIAEV